MTKKKARLQTFTTPAMKYYEGLRAIGAAGKGWDLCTAELGRLWTFPLTTTTHYWLRLSRRPTTESWPVKIWFGPCIVGADSDYIYLSLYPLRQISGSTHVPDSARGPLRQLGIDGAVRTFHVQLLYQE